MTNKEDYRNKLIKEAKDTIKSKEIRDYAIEMIKEYEDLEDDARTFLDLMQLKDEYLQSKR